MKFHSVYMIVVQNLTKKGYDLTVKMARHAHIISNSVSGERYRTTMVLLFIIPTNWIGSNELFRMHQSCAA